MDFIPNKNPKRLKTSNKMLQNVVFCHEDRKWKVEKTTKKLEEKT